MILFVLYKNGKKDKFLYSNKKNLFHKDIKVYLYKLIILLSLFSSQPYIYIEEN